MTLVLAIVASACGASAPTDRSNDILINDVIMPFVHPDSDCIGFVTEAGCIAESKINILWGRNVGLGEDDNEMILSTSYEVMGIVDGSALGVIALYVVACRQLSTQEATFAKPMEASQAIGVLPDAVPALGDIYAFKEVVSIYTLGDKMTIRFLSPLDSTGSIAMASEVLRLMLEWCDAPNTQPIIMTQDV